MPATIQQFGYFGYDHFLQWALRHAADLPRLAVLVEEVYQAGDAAEWWAAFKALGDAALPLVVDFPQLEEDAVFVTSADVENEICAAAAFDIGTLLLLWKQLQPLLPILMELIKR